MKKLHIVNLVVYYYCQDWLWVSAGITYICKVDPYRMSPASSGVIVE